MRHGGDDRHAGDRAGAGIGLCYATCAVSANWAAGKGEGVITMQEIDKHLKSGMEAVRRLLERVLQVL